MSEILWHVGGPVCLALGIFFWWLDRRQVRRRAEEWHKEREDREGL